MPTLLYGSSIAALVFGIGSLIVPLAILAIQAVMVGRLEGFDSGRGPQSALGIALPFAFGAWFLTYRRALLGGARWFRAFVLVSLAVPFCTLAVFGVSNGASVVRAVASVLVLVGAPAWYFYRKRSVVAFFRDSPPGLRTLGNVE